MPKKVLTKEERRTKRNTALRVQRAFVKGKTVKDLAEHEALPRTTIKKLVTRPRFVKELTQRRLKLAETSFTNAETLSKVIDFQSKKIQHDVEAGKTELTTQDMKDLAWITKSQGEQATALLKGAGTEEELDADGELMKTAKRLAAKRLEQDAAEANAPDPVEAEYELVGEA